VTAQAVIASLPVGLLVAAILHANNVRDVDLDRAAGKITLATLLGRRGANAEYVVLVAGAYLAAAVLVLSEWRLLPALIVAVSVPRAVVLVRLLTGATEARELNVALRGTAGLHLRFGAMLTVGLLVAALIDRVD
jgi:1,4-dihydroxy-2-naphthoate octaprenyltransferase